jgi:hypothetical protein
MGVLSEQLCMFMITHLIFHRMRNVSDNSCRGVQNTHFMFTNFFLKIVLLVK